MSNYFLVGLSPTNCVNFLCMFVRERDNSPLRLGLQVNASVRVIVWYVEDRPALLNISSDFSYPVFLPFFKNLHHQNY